jgi:hypothetical protein
VACSHTPDVDGSRASYTKDMPRNSQPSARAPSSVLCRAVGALDHARPLCGHSSQAERLAGSSVGLRRRAPSAAPSDCHRRRRLPPIRRRQPTTSAALPPVDAAAADRRSALIRHRQPSFDDGASNHGSVESRERRERERILEIHLSHGAVGSMEHAAARDRARHGTARYRAW